MTTSMTITAKQQKWLKAFHIFFIVLWTGGAFCITLCQIFIKPVSDGELIGMLKVLHFIDFFIIAPAASFTFITALLYAYYTNWGWFKHNWIIVKWIICVIGIIMGIYPLAPSLSAMVETASRLGMNSFLDKDFIFNFNLTLFLGAFQSTTVVLAGFISSIKPWKNKLT